jgi:hypothetical protein
LIARRHGPLIAQVLLVALLLGSMPMAASPVLAACDSAPAFTLDICHPLPVFAVGAASCTLAAFTAYSFSVVVEDRGPTGSSNIAVDDRAGDAPDPPPPKTIV